VEAANTVTADLEAKKAQAQEDRAAEVNRVAAALQARVGAVHSLLDGHLSRVSEWKSRAEAVAEETSRALRGTRTWPTDAEWAALRARVDAVVAEQPSPAEAAALALDAPAVSGRGGSGASGAPASSAGRDVRVVFGGEAAASPGSEAVRQLHAARAEADRLRAELDAARAQLEERDRACRALESSASASRYQLQAALARAEAAEAARGRGGAGDGVDEAELAALEGGLEQMLGDRGRGGDLVAPMRLLREACEGPGAAAGAAGGGDGALRDAYRRALLAMKARYDRERDMLHAQIREMTRLHREELRVAGALPEELTAVEKASWLEKENARLKEALACSREEHESEAQYQLYKQRVATERGAAELRERYNRDLTRARSEIAELTRELSAFRDGDWARQALAEEAAVKDAQTRAALVESQARHEQEVESLAEEAAGALFERDSLNQSLLQDLKRLRGAGAGGAGAGGAGFPPGDDTVTPFHTMPDALRLAEEGARALEAARRLRDGGTDAGAGFGSEQGDGGAGDDGPPGPSPGRPGYLNGHSHSAATPDGAGAGAPGAGASGPGAAGPGGDYRASADRIEAILRGDLGDGGDGPGDAAGQLAGMATEAERRAAARREAAQAPARRPASPGAALPPRPPSPREAARRRVDRVLGVAEPRGGGAAGPREAAGARDPPSPGRPDAGLACVRCGGNDATSPGVCRFHPALVADPGPLLYTVEWQACRDGGHRPGDAGCYARADHFYPVGVLRGARADEGEAPRPRGSLPRPVAGR